MSRVGRWSQVSRCTGGRGRSSCRSTQQHNLGHCFFSGATSPRTNTNRTGASRHFMVAAIGRKQYEHKCSPVASCSSSKLNIKRRYCHGCSPCLSRTSCPNFTIKVATTFQSTSGTNCYLENRCITALCDGWTDSSTRLQYLFFFWITKPCKQRQYECSYRECDTYQYYDDSTYICPSVAKFRDNGSSRVQTSRCPPTCY